MKIVKNQITDYVSINVENDETEWLSTNVYNFRDELRDGNFIYKYAGINGTNTELSPSVIYERDKELAPIWVLTRPTNYFALLDDKSSTQTENAESLVFEVLNGRYETFSLLNLEAQSVMIELIDITTAEIYQTINFDLLDRSDRIDALSHYFNPIKLKTNVYADNIYLLGNTKLKVTILNGGDIAKCGRLIFGRSYYIGETQYDGATLDLQSFSRFETDTFGNTDLKQGNSIRTAKYNVKIPTNKIISVYDKRIEYDAIPLLFIADESSNSKLENLLLFGYFVSSPISIKNPVNSNIPVDIKGLL